MLDPIASSPLDSTGQSLLATNTPPSKLTYGDSDGQWDSGCSDINDPPDLISFGESSENSCSFNDDPSTSTDVELTDDNEHHQQFQLEMTEEIDLDQIEKD